MLRKKKKSREEKTVEEFFPADEDNLKITTEKEIKENTPKEDLLKKSLEIPTKESLPVKEMIKKSVEKKYSKPDRKSLEKVEKTKKRKSSKRKSSKKRTVTKKVEYIPPKIKLKTKGYELIITEKPQAAFKIANALGKSEKKSFKNIPYYEVNRKGKKIIVACAVGHLFTLTQNNPGSTVPNFDISWMPNYISRKKDFTKKYYDTLLNLAKNAGSLTVATDFDVEGEVIGVNVVKYICNQLDAERMKFSTLTEAELNEAYDHKLKKINWPQAIAGETRHYLDWFYGINLSRALMNAIKTTGKFKIMSIGRVQGPALNLIVQKEKEIQNFKSEPYWQVFITVKNPKIELKYIKDLFKKEDLKKFEKLVGKKAVAKTTKKQNILPPNPPFNLTTLQTEAYKFHGITPSTSQKLPASINYKKILDILKIRYKVSKLITKNKPIEGKKTDPAHPSIYPTGNKQILSGSEEKIYNLIVKRFLSLFCDDAIINNKKVTATVDKLIFTTTGTEIKKKAWIEIYPSKLKEIKIPDVNGEVTIIDSQIEEKETQPPKRYSPASIISQLEKRNLGTKATRSSILETLYDRGYIKEKSIEATPLGISLIETLEKSSPIIIDEQLTKKFEQQMNSILENKDSKKEKLVKKEEKIIEEAKKTITKIAKDFEKNEKQIGKDLMDANAKLREEQKKENTLILCPKCKKGNLAITYSKKTRRHFVACDAYPDCKTTYSLPPNGIIKKTNRICEDCGFPKLQRLSKGKRPWEFCFNPNCETNKKRLEEYRKKQAITNKKD